MYVKYYFDNKLFIIIIFSPNTFQIDFENGMFISIREHFGYDTSMMQFIPLFW
jgi:hypothetical protein